MKARIRPHRSTPTRTSQITASNPFFQRSAQDRSGPELRLETHQSHSRPASLARLFDWTGVTPAPDQYQSLSLGNRDRVATLPEEGGPLPQASEGTPVAHHSAELDQEPRLAPEPPMPPPQPERSPDADAPPDRVDEPELEPAPDLAVRPPSWEESPPQDALSRKLREPFKAAESPLPAPQESDISVQLPEPPAVAEVEEVEPVESLALEGSSDGALVAFTSASPSQIAQTVPTLGEKLDQKIRQETEAEAAAAPVLPVQTSGSVAEDLSPPSPLLGTKPQIGDGVVGRDPGPLKPEPQSNLGAPPGNKASERALDEPREDGFLDWLRSNIRELLGQIKTTDPDVNTSAGDRPNVQLEGESDPDRMGRQREDAREALESQRDQTTNAFRNHPGQLQIQPKEVHQEKAVALAPVTPIRIEGSSDSQAADYAQAPLPPDVRARADELLRPGLEADLGAVRTKTEEAAATRDADKERETALAQSEAARINQQADQRQRDIVIDNRSEVARRQREGIEEAYRNIDEFDQQADSEQQSVREEIADKVDRSEAKAELELQRGEAGAERVKAEKEAEAAEKKRELERAKEKQSWWDRAVNAIKGAVKAITSAIDNIFSALRKAVKAIIEKAKALAIAVINAARDWVVDRLNDFRDWAKGMVDKYVKDIFPELARMVNDGIDLVVDMAVAGVNHVADQAIVEIESLADALAADLDKVLQVYQTALKGWVQITGAIVTGDFAGALRAALQAACDVAGVESKHIFDFVDRAADQILDILRHPTKFFNNLVAAVGGGVRSFAKNIKQHLVRGLVGWLTGALSEVAIIPPAELDAKGIFSLVTQVLGLTYEDIKARVIKKAPRAAAVFATIEMSLPLLSRLSSDGPIALWEEAKGALSDLGQFALSAIRGFLTDTVVKQALGWLLSLLSPASALVRIVKLLYDLVKFLVERFEQIKTFVLSVYGSIVAIASGALEKAMQAVEDALGRSLPVVIGLLASLAGLSGIGKSVKDIIAKASRPVRKIVDTVVDKIVAFAQRFLKKLKGAAAKVREKAIGWWNAKKGFRDKNGVGHTLFFEGSGPTAQLTIKSKKRPVRQFLADASPKTPSEQGALQEAWGLAAEIDTTTHKQIDANLNDQQREDAEKRKERRVKEPIDRLAQRSARLFPSLPTWTAKTDYPTTRGGFGEKVTGPVITSRGMPGGSPPTQSPHATYDKLNRRRKAGGASYYVRGHLLSKSLGGPGVWTNMTPLTRAANALHFTKVESTIIAAVKFPEAVIEYNVEAVRGDRGDAKTLIEEVKPGRSAEDGKALEEVIHAEEFVPKKLELEYRYIQPKPSGFKREVVHNKVEREPWTYHLSDKKGIKPVKINSLTGPEKLENPPLPEPLRKLAPEIYAAVDKRRREREPKFVRYGILANEVKGLTEEQARSWNKQGFIVL